MLTKKAGAIAAGAFLGALVLASLIAARAADVKNFRFGYDQPHTTGYGVAADIFADKLKELSKGTMLIDQFPGAQLGQEPQMLQLVKTGDIDFIISSTANAATVSPESGVLSIHYIFRSEDHLKQTLADPKFVAAVRKMFDETVQGAHVLTVLTLGLRDLYGKREIHKIDDLKGVKVRVQATATEDTMFPAYGAQTVHMPFGQVYTSLQTGVVDMAENGVNVYLSNKHYEVAPIMSLTQHEANNSVLWVSDKVWSSLGDEQKGWVQQAANEVGQKQPAKALELEHESQVKLEKIGVKFVTDVDKSGFEKIAEPIQDKLAKELGPHAVEILGMVRAEE
ncbi:MAG TPA: TRAP transporter substrate-binding protein [Alphaproteobacteria bacterium]|nr:TRAP transporter substrate-binding protein [Alphaproteobacteria bacterium]